MCFNVNRCKSVIYPLRIIHARFMKIYVLCPEGAIETKETDTEQVTRSAALSGLENYGR